MVYRPWNWNKYFQKRKILVNTIKNTLFTIPNLSISIKLNTKSIQLLQLLSQLLLMLQPKENTKFLSLETCKLPKENFFPISMEVLEHLFWCRPKETSYGEICSERSKPRYKKLKIDLNAGNWKPIASNLRLSKAVKSKE